MRLPNDVYALRSGSPAEGADIQACSYFGKLLASGPDAAIEVVGDQIRQFMFGLPSENDAFAELIRDYRNAILATADKLRLEAGDRVVFTGIWFHIDFDQRPWFECYQILVISSDGIVHSRPYDIEMFDHDNPKEGIVRISASDATSAEHLMDCLLATAFGMTGESSASTSGIPRLQGVVWYPSSGKGKSGLPIVVSKIYEICRSDRKPEDIEVLRSDLSPAQQDFRDAHLKALTSGAISNRLSQAFAELHRASPAMKQWALRELANSIFGTKDGRLVIRGKSAGPITLSELANSGDAGGYWFQVRNKDGLIQVSGFKRFDDTARMGLNDDRAIFSERVGDLRSDACGCELASEWSPTRTGSSVRFLARGSEPGLSW